MSETTNDCTFSKDQVKEVVSEHDQKSNFNKGLIFDKIKLSGKFYLGVFMVIGSLIIGKITLFTFLAYFNQPSVRWTSVIVYVLSWPVLILGVYWAGKEYAVSLQKYFRYKFYHESVKKGTKQVYHRTKAVHDNVKKKVHHKTKEVRHKVKNKTKAVHDKVKNKIKKPNVR